LHFARWYFSREAAAAFRLAWSALLESANGSPQ
jgi:hypothetical protein